VVPEVKINFMSPFPLPSDGEEDGTGDADGVDDPTVAAVGVVERCNDCPFDVNIVIPTCCWLGLIAKELEADVPTVDPVEIEDIIVPCTVFPV